MVSEGLELRIDQQGATLNIGISYAGFHRHADRRQAEFFALVLLRICCKLIGHQVPPVATFRSSAVGYGTNPEAVRRDVQFGCNADRLNIDATLLDHAVIDGDPYLDELMAKLCNEAIDTRATNFSSFRALVENTFTPLLPHGEGSVENVARQIGVGERTFARRLASEARGLPRS